MSTDQQQQQQQQQRHSDKRAPVHEERVPRISSRNGSAIVALFLSAAARAVSSKNKDRIETEGKKMLDAMNTTEHNKTMMMPPYTGPDRFSTLPVEILFQIMDCLPAASLVYSLGPTSSRFAHLVDLYLRQTVTRRLAGLPFSHHQHHHHQDGESESESESEKKARFTLCFEARRPIDTTATTHELTFDRFEVNTAAYKPSDSIAVTYAKVWNPSEKVQRRAHRLMQTTAVFRFVAARTPGTDDKGKQTAQRGQAGRGGAAPDGPTPADAPVWQALRQPYVPSVPNRHAHQMRERDLTSSVAPPDSAAAGPSHAPQESAGGEAEAEAEEEEEAAEERELRHTVDAYDWAPSRTIGSHSRSTKSATAPALPTYRCQLDPLDSFETFVLSLLLKTSRTCPTPSFANPAAVEAAQVTPSSCTISSSSKATVRTRVFERRVASGCDRVIRNWFAPPAGPATPTEPRSGPATPSAVPPAAAAAGPSSSSTTSLSAGRLSSLAALASDLGAPLDACVPRSILSQAQAAHRRRDPDPPTRTLEIDGASCVVVVQPHASADSILRSHPILRASTSASWSGASSPSPSPSSGGRPGSSPSDVPASQQSSPGSSSSSNANANATAWMFTSPFASPSFSSSSASTTTPSSSPYSPLGGGGAGHVDMGSRVDLTFHCAEVRVRAARLLAMLHRVEDDVCEGEEQERKLYLRQLERSGRLRLSEGAAEGEGSAGTGLSGAAGRSSVGPAGNRSITIWTMQPGGTGEVTHQLTL
ncbi:hypothetical protein OC834_001259 [Tilletia horrida]|nr:hypothetical protein OC834_001259 [Tilletia horrida]